MRKLAVTTSAIVGALMLAQTAARPALAECESEVLVTPRQIGQRAELIVLARVSSFTRLVARPDPVDLDIVRVIKGRAGDTLHIEQPLTDPCESLYVPVGSRIVLASSFTGHLGRNNPVTYYPTWVELDNGSWIGPSFQGDLASLIEAFEIPPETDTVRPGVPASTPQLPLLAAAGLAAALLFRRRLGTARSS